MKKKSEVRLQTNKSKAMTVLLKRWSTGDARPENGAFAGFQYMDRWGKVAQPKFF